MQFEWMQALIIVTTSIGAAMLALVLLTYVYGRPAAPKQVSIHPVLEPTVFLFDDQRLVDATGPAHTLLGVAPMGSTEWARLAAFVAPHFNDFDRAMGQLAEQGRIEMTERAEYGKGSAGQMRLIAEDVSGLSRITLIDPSAEGRGILVDGLSQRAIEDELEQLRNTLDLSPLLIWREDENRSILWANRAYLTRSGAFAENEESLVWPLPRLFEIPEDAGLQGPRRLRLEDPETRVSWFDCHSFTLAQGRLHFALPADATVRAEKALRDFVQILTKTFADLPIGLAIFDRRRQLQLFNPALIDLTQLGPQFLSGRPTLYAFLDRLREARMMPEPKDYRTWRLKMTELEQAAAAGFHCETWNLPSGQTYRVTGRPHPDGAIAFLFEDITSEMSLTRRFRAEIEMGQEVLDLMSESVAVFQPSGELSVSNSAFSDLWGFGAAEGLETVTLLDAVRRWQKATLPSPIWTELREFSTRLGERRTIEAEVTLASGGRMRCRFCAMNGGAMMASFLPLETAEPAPLLARSAADVTASRAHQGALVR